ncbi:insulinase family protein [Streptomyces sp. NPDC093109]|uniref:M16 family metallopeptidase n=1 Tax=Streptomyces sp. NPDC093109 TaxID=3154977 RepID=UPI00344E1604
MTQSTTAATTTATATATTAATTATATPGFQVTEVDGIRTVLATAPSKNTPGTPDTTDTTDTPTATPTPTATATATIKAGLVFRVGTADETHATHGITHLVEHLALHRHGVSDLHYNGATAATYTLFVVDGTAEEVVTYLNGVCAALRDLPMERLETEREILRTEAAGRSRGPNRQLPLWRYGAQGYGLSSTAELGSWHLTADAVRDWARTRFTCDNAVLWISGTEVPPGLSLTLPTGTGVRPLPAATSALPRTPAHIVGENGVVVMDGVVRRSVAGAVFAEVLGRALFADLRQKGGYSYAAGADYTPRDNGHATITAVADALAQKQDAVVGGFVDVFARLRLGRIEQSELDAVRATFQKRYDTPDSEAARLPAYALNLLIGYPNRSVEEHRAELAAVTVEDLHEVARELYSTALLQVPGREAAWAGFAEAPHHSTGPALPNGTRHPAHEDPDTVLTVAPEGISLTVPDGTVTVRYDACAAMVAFPDGARHLTGLDGFRTTVEPTLYAGLTPDRIAAIDAAVPRARVVPMPPRDEERIPRPDPSLVNAAVAASAPEPAFRKWCRRILMVTFGFFAAIMTLVALVGTADELDAESPEFGSIVVFWVFPLIPLAAIHVLRKAKKKQDQDQDQKRQQ